MKRNKKNPVIQLNDEQKKRIIREIRAFYLDVRGEEIGIIQEEQILELFCEHMAPIIYNKALDDACLWYRQQIENLSSDYYMLYKNN